MTDQNQQMLRKIPSVDAVMADPRIASCCGPAPRPLVVDAVRAAIEDLRRSILSGSTPDPDTLVDTVVSNALEIVGRTNTPQYRRAVNAAGIILHTGLGRAVLPTAAVDRINEHLRGYAVLQVGLDDGKRSKRDERIEWLLKKLTGAEAATVVNNNAAGTALVLNTVGTGREVIVSRGQLVEIGGAFRLPDVMAFSGAKLVEVGTTNKTHARDYANAITEETAAILRVHPSNYKIQGFSSEVPLDELVDIAHSNGLVLIDDIGAGALIDFSRFGFEPEPTLPDSIAAGADLVTSSADKLIGAAQGGVIAGRADLVQAVRKNQFARIVRADKLTLAALEATLEIFLDESRALQEVPTLAMTLRDPADIARSAKRIASALARTVGADIARIETAAGYSQLGSGSLPTQNLATTLVTVAPASMSAATLANRLRTCDTPVFTRIGDDRVLIDPRTLLAGDDKIVIASLTAILTGSDNR